MWSVREEAERSLPETLARLKEIGYSAVETAASFKLAPLKMRDRLASAGLQVASAHQRLPEDGSAEKMFEFAAKLGAPAVFTSLSAENFIDDTAIGRSADRLNSAVDRGDPYGIEFGYHNHWWEFATEFNGDKAYDLLLARLDPRITVQVDTYWAQVGGVDAAKLVSSLGDRVRYLHVKDGPLDSESSQVAVGDGKMDTDRVLGANAHVRWHIVELDECEDDIWETLRRSLEYLSAWQGRTS